MRRLKKAIVTIGLSVMMLTSFATTSFAGHIVYEKVEDEVISSGVTYKNILRFTDSGWLNLNAVYIDLNNSNTRLDVLTSSGGLSTKETLSSMVKREENVVAAINGDFFYMLNPDSPLGAIVKDGEMISSPITVQDFATFFINNNGQAFADYWTHEIFATTSSGKTIPIASINKYTDEYQYIMLIDKNWGEYSPGYSEKLQDMVEVVVVDDIVVEIRQKQPAIRIPENGYILLASKGSSPWAQADLLLSSVNIGDEITVHKNLNLSLEDISLAIGGGTVLVRDGQVANFTQNLSTPGPRTAIGISKDRSQIIFVTIDGRHSSYKGVNGVQLANYLIELGSYEAIALDGGGSTTMLKRSLGDFDPKLINHPSDLWERKIINGIAVKAGSPKDELMGIRAELDDQRSFPGASRKIDVKAFDRNYNPLSIDGSLVNLQLKSGEGTFDGLYFIPSAPGKAIIEVEYLGALAEVTLDVLPGPAYIEISPEAVRLNKEQAYSFNIVGVDPEGYKAKIHAKDMVWEDLQGLGTFEDGLYKAGNISGVTQIEGRFGSTVATVDVAIGNTITPINNFETLDTAFLAYPQTVAGSVSLDPNAQEGMSSIRLDYDFTQGDETRAAYIIFDTNRAVISDPAVSIGVWAYSFEPSTHWIRGKIQDSNGVDHIIDFTRNMDWEGWKYLTASLPEGLAYPVKMERLYLVEIDPSQKVKGQILFDGLEAIHKINLPAREPKNPIVADPWNKPYTVEGEKLFVYRGLMAGENMPLDPTITDRLTALINNQYGLALFTGDLDPELSSKITRPVIVARSGYGYVEQGNSLMIQLDTLKDGLRSTNFDQWPWLQNLLKNANQKNIFVVMSQPLFGSGGFTDQLEAELLMKMFTDLYESGKQVFVIYEGETLATNIVNGVRYISTGAYSSNQAKDPGQNHQYIEFNINNQEVTYQIKSIFE